MLLYYCNIVDILWITCPGYSMLVRVCTTRCRGATICRAAICRPGSALASMLAPARELVSIRKVCGVSPPFQLGTLLFLVWQV